MTSKVPCTPLAKPFVQGWFMAFFSLNEKARHERFTTRRVYLSTDDNPDYQRDLLLDFYDHGENGIGVYEGFPSKHTWVCTFKFDDNGNYTFAKREGVVFSDNDAYRLLCTFIVSVTPNAAHMEL